MPQRDPGVYLEDIEHYAAAAVRFTSGFSLQQYLADEKTRAAVERVLEVCGEAMSNLYRVAPAVAETIPHARDIIGFRNILAHGYAELDHNKVYNIAIAHALRKVRWAIKGKGKSGGVRVIYFYVTVAAQIRLIAIYKKGIKDDLNAAEKKALKKLNENW